MLSGASAFEISDIQESETAAVVLRCAPVRLGSNRGAHVDALMHFLVGKHIGV
jgi:hypothetical protein